MGYWYPGGAGSKPVYRPTCPKCGSFLNNSRDGDLICLGCGWSDFWETERLLEKKRPSTSAPQKPDQK